MFWVYLLVADLDGNIRRVRGRAEGGTATQGFANGKDSGNGVGGL